MRCVLLAPLSARLNLLCGHACVRARMLLPVTPSGPVSLVGFSKGSVVLNEVLAELHVLARAPLSRTTAAALDLCSRYPP